MMEMHIIHRWQVIYSFSSGPELFLELSSSVLRSTMVFSSFHMIQAIEEESPLPLLDFQILDSVNVLCAHPIRQDPFHEVITKDDTLDKCGVGMHWKTGYRTE